jgi:hypothetical protein
MVEATPPTLAARNAYAVLLVTLMVLFVYQSVAVIENDIVIEVLFYTAASVYLVSWYYYRRGSDEGTPAEEDSPPE